MRVKSQRIDLPVGAPANCEIKKLNGGTKHAFAHCPQIANA